jgi:chromosome partitioning protein
MADEPIDHRPRRRLFGRRRLAPVDDTAHVERAQVMGNGETESELPTSAPEPPAVRPPDREAQRAADEPREAAEREATEPEPAGPDAEKEPEIVEPRIVEAKMPDPQVAATTVGEPEVIEPAVSAPAATTEPPGAGPEPSRAPSAEPDPGPAVEADASPGEAPAGAGGGQAADAAFSDHEHAGELPLPRVIAIANQKGGVGKTTTAVNLGAALAEAGFRVLVVDLDPQGNASTGLGINPRDVESSIYNVLMNDAPALDCVEPTSLKNLFVLPATIDLAGAEIELVSAFSRELKLRRALDSVRSEYDVILIDCPPSLGLLTVNGLAAADDVIVPVQSEYYALEGLGQLLKNVAMIRSVNPTLDVRGIVLTMHDSRTKLAEQVESEVREHFGARVYKTVVPRTVRLSEAPSFGQPIIVFDPTSRGATAYRDLAKEVSGGATRRTG